MVSCHHRRLHLVAVQVNDGATVGRADRVAHAVLARRAWHAEGERERLGEGWVIEAAGTRQAVQPGCRELVAVAPRNHLATPLVRLPLERLLEYGAPQLLTPPRHLLASRAVICSLSRTLHTLRQWICALDEWTVWVLA